ncbi:Alginate lyase [Frateuria aurantia DSM 6220]|uniref:Alginate lyase n=2 Tax=Frateuria aurantia TaxID=81475 RepID=H8L424_FRAAD|nr:Alginate lyase [Frateuria aurantia DSM 6220]
MCRSHDGMPSTRSPQRHAPIGRAALMAGLCLTLLCGSPAVLAVDACRPRLAADTTELAPMLQQLQASIDRPPTPMPALHTEGTLPHQGIHDQSALARRDLPLMQHAALAWQVTGDPRWLQMARRYLFSWIGTYRPSLNPIDETGFDALIDTYVIIRPALDHLQREQTRNYLRDWAWAYVSAMRHPGHQGSWRNNWQSHRVKLVTLMAVATGDSRLFDAARQLFRQQLDINLLVDGEVLDYRQRDALHYVVYDLQPLLQAALAARTHGEDWYHWRNGRGASLASAIAWLLPYATGQRSHQEFVYSHVQFDAERARAGLPGFSGRFDPHKAGMIYWLAAEWDPALLPLARRLQPTPPSWLPLCTQAAPTRMAARRSRA